MGLREVWHLPHAMMRKQNARSSSYLASSVLCLNERFWEKPALFASSGNLCAFGGPGAGKCGFVS